MATSAENVMIETMCVIKLLKKKSSKNDGLNKLTVGLASTEEVRWFEHSMKEDDGNNKKKVSAFKVETKEKHRPKKIQKVKVEDIKIIGFK